MKQEEEHRDGMKAQSVCTKKRSDFLNGAFLKEGSVMRTKRLIMLGAALFLVAGLWGCGLMVAGGAAGAGVYAYAQGELQRSYGVPMDKAIMATKKTANTLNLIETGIERDSIKTIMRYKKSDNTEVTIRVQRMDVNQTEIGVRVGLVGVWDKDQAETIHNYIRENLKV